MLYSIIPPVLVVLSLIGIILFLMKKAPAVARLETETNVISEEEKKERELSARYAALKKENKKPVKEVLRIFFSKLWGKLKSLGGLFGRFYAWRKIALKKRNNHIGKKLDNDQTTREDFFSKETEDAFRIERKDRVAVTDEEEYLPEEPRAEKSMAELEAEKEIVAKVQKKDLFEKILIDRIAANPKDIEAYERLGEYYLEIENWNYAKECFKQVIKLNPKNTNAKSKMRKLEKILSRR